MTGKKQELSERIQREFEICEKHLSRIDEALEVALPLTVDAYVDLSGLDVRCLDQFIFRFAKLQDALGAKMFRSVSHDYPMVANEEVDTFNALIKKVETLRDVKERLQKWIK